MADRTWELTAAPAVSYTSAWLAARPWLFLTLGLAITLLLAIHFLTVQRRTAQAEALNRSSARDLVTANARLEREVADRTWAEAMATAGEVQLRSILDTTIAGTPHPRHVKVGCQDMLAGKRRTAVVHRFVPLVQNRVITPRAVQRVNHRNVRERSRRLR